MISDEKAEAALTFLAETDEEAAELKADVERRAYALKAIRSTVFSLSEGSVADRQALADTDPKVESHWIAHCEAIKRYNTVANKRATQTLVIEVWRSVNANRRRG